jgi:hypothetical protein
VPTSNRRQLRSSCYALDSASKRLENWVLQIATLRSAQDEAFNRQLREQVELAETAELQKLVETRDRALEQKAAQLQQLEEMKARILADRAANKTEVSSYSSETYVLLRHFTW